MQFPLKAPPVERAASCPQKLSTKLPGKRPVLPFLCNVPLYQPSSRFLCTNTMSPSFSSISASLCGGYGTTTRYLWRQNRKDLVTQWSSLHLMGAGRNQNQQIVGKTAIGNTGKLRFFHTNCICCSYISYKTAHDRKISDQLDWRLGQGVLWSQTVKAGRYCQMAGLLAVVLAPTCVISLCQGLSCFLLALHLPLLWHVSFSSASAPSENHRITEWFLTTTLWIRPPNQFLIHQAVCPSNSYLSNIQRRMVWGTASDIQIEEICSSSLVHWWIMGSAVLSQPTCDIAEVS